MSNETSTHEETAPIYTGIVDFHWDDGSYDLDEVREGGVTAAIAKCTEGVTFMDRGFVQAVDRLGAAGMLVGAYHFARNTSDPKAQADAFVGDVRALLCARSEVLLCLDLEGALHNPTTMTTANAVVFLQRVFDAVGRWPVVYQGASKQRERMGEASDAERAVFGRCPNWTAAYGADPLKSVPPRPWSAWSMFQYTNGTKGPRDRVRFPRRTKGFTRQAQDRSCFRGSAADLAAFWRACGR